MMKGLMFHQQQQQVVEENMSNLTSASGEASVSSGNRNEIGTNYPPQQYFASTPSQAQPQVKKKRNLPGNPDPDAEVIALSPKSLLATNRFICEICNKGFQRDQNLQLHRRGHNLPWKLKQRTNKEVRKKVYVCPEATCVHHDPARALGDLTGIKKHFCRKHGEKKWKCDKCSKRYAVQSDWKAHSKTCGTREYRCDCGTLFSRRDSFITHRAFCDALAEESARANPLVPSQTPSSSSSASHILNIQTQLNNNPHHLHSLQLKQEHQQSFNLRPEIPPWLACPPPPLAPGPSTTDLSSPSSSSMFTTRFDRDFSRAPHGQDLSLHENPNPTNLGPTLPSAYQPAPSPHMSATALLQKAAQMGATMTKTAPMTKTGSSNTTPAMIRTHHQTHVPHPASDSAATNSISSSGHFGLNLSSRESAVLLPPSAPSATTAAAAASSSGVPPPPPFLLHDVMSSFSATSGGFEGTSFEDAFGGILNSKNKDESFLDTLKKTTTPVGHLSGAADDGGGKEGLTRDFLGLRPLSHNEILSIAGIGNCMNPTTSHDQQNQSQNSWQG
ncbi:protein indeterminate-domain 7 [Prosopis cineraria]|uniref:protein indeterminate-domain 7 n=1 Tax=Prosopis cineraria TaxID=364024 RepID=UPI00240F87ED|nr:protein indeterminate-domain 7 [Prosopis cineraria]